MSYYNTLGIADRQLRDAIEKTTKQEKIVLLLFEAKKEMTPCECHAMYVHVVKNTPLTSIRRAITDLTTKGSLIQTGSKRLGIYGKDNYVWKIKE